MTPYDAMVSPPTAEPRGRRPLREKVKPESGGVSAEHRSRMILQAMVAFRDGDFSVRLPTDWTDTDGLIATAFNQTITQKHGISGEFMRLRRTVGEEGRLRQRMTLPGATGGWAVDVESINTLIDDLVRPTTEIARTIGAVAKGDLGQSMDLEVD
jgi:methyl-accepting chemotaxis protein